MNKTIAKIKQANSSVAFMLAALCFTLALVASALNVGSLGTALQKALQSMVTEQSIADSVNRYLLPVLQGVTPYTYITLAFSLLVAIGMWLHFFANKSAGDQVSFVGLSVIRVVKVIEAVTTVLVWLGTGIMAAFTLLVAFTGIKEANPDTDMGVYYIVLFAALAVYLAALAFVVFYYRGILRTMRSVRMTLSTGVIMGKVSGYVIVVNYVLAFFTLIGAVLSPQLFGLIGGLLQALSLIFTSIAMTRLRGEMRYIAIRGGDHSG